MDTELVTTLQQYKIKFAETFHESTEQSQQSYSTMEQYIVARSPDVNPCSLHKRANASRAEYHLIDGINSIETDIAAKNSHGEFDYTNPESFAYDITIRSQRVEIKQVPKYYITEFFNKNLFGFNVNQMRHTVSGFPFLSNVVKYPQFCDYILLITSEHDSKNTNHIKSRLKVTPEILIKNPFSNPDLFISDYGVLSPRAELPEQYEDIVFPANNYGKLSRSYIHTDELTYTFV